MKVCIIGTGYVGLVTGACFAERGHHVICVDSNEEKVSSIRRGVAPIHELGLSDLLSRNVGSRLDARVDLESAVMESEVVLVCVGTPFREDKIDLSQVVTSARQIGAIIARTNDYKVVAVKSTVIPGTTCGVFCRELEQSSGKKAGADFGLGMNPEFLTEGSAVEDFMAPDRIVIGGVDERSCHTLEKLYEAWPHAPRVITNTQTAEMIKYASNSVLAVMISFSNEIARLCAGVSGVDVVDVMRGVHHAGYFTVRSQGGNSIVAPITSFLGAGCGFGGSCLPKDVSALVAQGAEFGVDMPLLRSVLEINKGQPYELLSLVTRHFPSLSGVRVALLGIAFKPDTDDIRESPAFPIVRLLKAHGAKIKAFDPVANPGPNEDFAGVELAASLEGAVADAEVIVLVTRWQQFSRLPQILDAAGHNPLVVDGRRMLNPKDYQRYEGIGLS